MVNNKNSKLHKKPTTTMQDSVMLLLWHRLLMDAVMYRALQKIRQLMAAKKKHHEQQPVCKRKEIV
jgi:hypothetical protein